MYRQPRSGFTRIPYVQRCRVELAGEERVGLVCNVSVLGCYLQIDPLPEVGRELTLTFQLLDDEQPIVAGATVAWINERLPESAESLPPGCGVRFNRLTPADLRRLSAMVTAFREDPRPLLHRIEPQIDKVRIPFVAPCVLAAKGGPRLGSVCNLSTEGIYVAIEPAPAAGEAVIVSFRLPGHEETFERAAIVAWVNAEGGQRVRALPPGCGLRFVNLSDSDVVVLTDLVDRYAGLLVEAREAGGGER